MPSISPSGGGAGLSQLLEQFNSRNKPKPFTPASAFSAPQSSKGSHHAQSLAAAISSSKSAQHSQNSFASKLKSAVRPDL